MGLLGHVISVSLTLSVWVHEISSEEEEREGVALTAAPRLKHGATLSVPQAPHHPIAGSELRLGREALCPGS